MTIEVDYDDVWNALDWAGVDPDVRPNYSGRGMYGDLCLGIVLDYDSDFIKFVRYLQREVADDEDNALYEFVEKYLDNVSTDSMGRRGIWYWRGVKVVNVPEDADL